MATERKKMPKYDDGKVNERVAAFAKVNGYAAQEAWDYLAQYALNRLDVLARNTAKRADKAAGKANKAARKKAVTK